MPDRNYHTISNLKTALETYTARNRVYGNNYKRFGSIMMALYPNGVELKTEEDWNRFGVIIQLISKLSRYVTAPKHGHLDSIHDMGVYSLMLEELDAEAAGLDVESPIKLVTTISNEEERMAVLPGACEHIYQYTCQKLHPARQCTSFCSVCNISKQDHPELDKGANHTFLGKAHNCGKPTCTLCGERSES